MFASLDFQAVVFHSVDAEKDDQDVACATSAVLVAPRPPTEQDVAVRQKEHVERPTPAILVSPLGKPCELLNKSAHGFILGIGCSSGNGIILGIGCISPRRATQMICGGSALSSGVWP